MSDGFARLLLGAIGWNKACLNILKLALQQQISFHQDF